MKKYLIVAAAICLSMVSCNKAGVSPEFQTVSTEKTAIMDSASFNKEIVTEPNTSPVLTDKMNIEPVNKCYTITNTEKSAGLVEYKFSYTDWEGVIHVISLASGQSISFSSTDGRVNANFQYFLIEGGGNCGPRRNTLPPGPCDLLTISNPYGDEGIRLKYGYTDCSGAYTQGVLNPQSIVYISAVPGTVICPGGVITAQR